ncbi:MAG: MBL fold metallo-hydrolase [Clostridia bacterium]|nr:MBL fold metallo-hydrolase [Clostridia bacterium]
MKITFLGTGAAEGIPALFCNCEFCKGARKRGEIRSRSQVLLGGELSIEFPPDAFYHAVAFHIDLSAIKYLLVTHSHMDHFYAHDFVLRGYKYAREMTSPTIDIYGNAEGISVFGECTRRELRGDVAENIRLHTVSAFEEFEVGGWRVHTLIAKHSSQEPLLYALEKDGKRILHLTDTSLLPEEDYLFLEQIGGKPFDLVVLDCTFVWGRAKEDSRHMGVEDDMQVLSRLEKIGLVDGKTKKVITHFSHHSEPTKENLQRAEKTYGVIAAYDGLTLEI